jgi:hypothetical protein
VVAYRLVTLINLAPPLRRGFLCSWFGDADYPRRLTSLPSQYMPNLQFVGSLYFDFTLGLAKEFMLDQAKGIADDLDALTLPLRFHAACDVHGIAPETIDEFLAAPCIGFMRPRARRCTRVRSIAESERTGKPPAIAGPLTTCCDIVRRLRIMPACQESRRADLNPV